MNDRETTSKAKYMDQNCCMFGVNDLCDLQKMRSTLHIIVLETDFSLKPFGRYLREATMPDIENCEAVPQERFQLIVVEP